MATASEKIKALLEDIAKNQCKASYDFSDSKVGIKELSEIAKKESYTSPVLSDIELLSKQIDQEKEKAFEQNKNEILRALKMEIASRHDGERGRIQMALSDDPQVLCASRLLKDQKAYSRLLGLR